MLNVLFHPSPLSSSRPPAARLNLPFRIHQQILDEISNIGLPFVPTEMVLSAGAQAERDVEGLGPG